MAAVPLEENVRMLILVHLVAYIQVLDVLSLDEVDIVDTHGNWVEVGDSTRVGRIVYMSARRGSGLC